MEPGLLHETVFWTDNFVHQSAWNLFFAPDTFSAVYLDVLQVMLLMLCAFQHLAWPAAISFLST